MIKKISFLLAIAAIGMTLPSTAQIDNLTNMSPEWVRCGARNASLDGTDIVVYNPGGVAWLKPGFHITAGNQFTFRKPKHEYTLDMGGGPVNYSYQQDGNDLVAPNINFSFNKDNWAVFGGFNVVAGGGEANFSNGSITTDLVSLQTMYFLNMMGMTYTHSKDAHFQSSAFDFSTSLGGAYAVNDKVSFGLMLRYIMGKNKTEAGFTLQDASSTYPDYPFMLQSEDQASGMGMVFGMDIKPTAKLNLAARYESKVSMEYDTDSIRDDIGIITEGMKNHRDLPAVFGFGASYEMSAKTRLLFDFNYYFQKQADWETTDIAGVEHETSELAGDASSYAIAAEYRFNPKFMWSLGVNYTMFSFEDQAGYFTNPGAFEIAPGNNVAISTGFAWNPSEKMRINAGFTQAIYEDQKIKSMNYDAFGMNVDVNTTNSISIIGIGVDFMF
jgi:long-chain fatty acid transport protein